jgi:hypothetical protein
MAVEIEKIEKELERISIKLHGDCQRLDMTALYAAQQALSWVLDNQAFKAPYDSILRTTGQAEKVIGGTAVGCGGDIASAPISSFG